MLRFLAILISYLVIASAQPQPPRIHTAAGSLWVGDGGFANEAILLQVQGITADSQGNIYVSDTDSHRVRRIGLDGRIVTVAGTGASGYSGDGGAAAAAQLDSPYGLATDPQGNLYIADLGNARIRRVRPSGQIDAVAGGGSLDPTAENQGGAATLYRLSAPRNVAVAPDGSLYFSDFAAHRLYRVAPGGWLTIAAGTGDAALAGDNGPATQAMLNSPAGLAFDAQGTLFFADSGNRRIRAIENGRIRTLAVAGVPTGVAIDAGGVVYAADPGRGQLLRIPRQGPVTATASPARDVAVHQGFVFLASGSAVERMSPFGSVTRVAGGGNTAHGDGGRADRARLHFPSAIARDAAGNLYIADRGNHRVRRVTPEGIIHTFAGTGAPGFAGDGGPAAQAQLRSPMGVAVDETGHVFIADTGNNRIRSVSPAGVITTLAGTGEPGFAGDQGPAVAAQLREPSYVMLDGVGGLLIADTANHRVRRVSLTSGRISTIAGDGSTSGQGDGGPAAEASLSAPRGLVRDAAGNLYITEIDGRRIRRITPAGIIQTLGAGGWSGPRAVAILPDGGLAVAETAAHRVRVIRAGAVTDLAGTGKPAYSGDGGAPTDASLNAPFDLIALADGRMWIADAFNHVIRRIDPGALVFDSVQLLDVRHAATGEPGPVAPGMLVEISGSGARGEARVFFGELESPAVTLRGGALLAVVPETIRGSAAGLEVSVVWQSESRGSASVALAEANPGLFARAGWLAALSGDGLLLDAETPAPRGSVVTMFATGTGIAQPLRLRVGDWDAEIVFAGPAPGLPGLWQINARLPAGFFPPGRYEVRLEAGSARSPAGVGLRIR